MSVATLLTLGATLAATALLFVGAWIVSLRRRDCGVADLVWGPGFVVIAWIELAAIETAPPATLALAALTTLWGARLALGLWRRHARAEAEDARYAAMRARGGTDWPRRSLTRLFLLQAVVLWVVAAPIHAGILGARPTPSAWLAATGGLVFAAGFALEVAADRALARFADDPANRGRLLTTGLFAWSRHPNYFGEATLWWGLALIAVATSGQVIAFVGPALLTWLLLKVSGIPPLEEQLRSRPGFADYAARVSAFVPIPPRR